jgi:fibronectin-binding autotransporter adhesin
MMPTSITLAANSRLRRYMRSHRLAARMSMPSPRKNPDQANACWTCLKTSLKTLAAALAFMLSFAVVAHGSDWVNTDPNSGSFGDPTRWHNGRVPGAADRVNFYTYGYAVPDVALHANHSTGLLNIRGVGADFVLNGFTYTVAGLSVQEDVNIVEPFYFSIYRGTLRVTSADANIGWASGSGTAYILTGATLKVDQTLYLGRNNTFGDLYVDSSTSRVEAADLVMGAQQSTYRGGRGAMHLDRGAMQIANTSTLADAADGTGAAYLKNGSVWTTGGTLNVARYGVGRMEIESGSKVSNAQGEIAVYSGAIGRVEVTGAGSQWNNSVDLDVGLHGNGDLKIRDGGVVTNRRGFLGRTGGLGSATVEGVGSHWNNATSFYVGYAGNGYLTVQAGGKVTNSFGYIGAFAGSTASTATVTGAGSTWENADDLMVGSSAVGSMSVLAGGTVADDSGYIGRFTGASGTATVSGAGSAWNNRNNLYVGGSETGNGGVGALTIADNGLVSVAQLTKIWNGDTLTVNGGTLSTASLDRSLGTFNHDNGTVKINGGSYTQPAGRLNITGNSATALPSFQLLGGATTSAGSVVNVAVGNNGSRRGELVVSGGSKLTNAGLVSLADDAGDTGTATVSGPDSLWSNTGDFYAGYTGSGTLNIQSGGKVTSARGFLGYNAAATGAATVTGTGSQWTNAGPLYVGGTETGSGGQGRLIIADGGMASAPTTIVWQNGALAGGGGTLASNLRNYGVVAPGNSTGMLTINGNFQQEPVGALQIELGGAASLAFDVLRITGVATLAGQLQLSLVDGFLPTAGDSFEFLTAAGGLSGMFAPPAAWPSLPGNLSWQIDYGANKVMLSVVAPVRAGDFDRDGDVDGADFLTWQRGESPNGLSESDLSDWRANFGMTTATTTTAATMASVPEPATGSYGVLAAALVFAQRAVRRRATQG